MNCTANVTDRESVKSILVSTSEALEEAQRVAQALCGFVTEPKPEKAQGELVIQSLAGQSIALRNMSRSLLDSLKFIADNLGLYQ